MGETERVERQGEAAEGQRGDIETGLPDLGNGDRGERGGGGGERHHGDHPTAVEPVGQAADRPLQDDAAE